MGCSKLKCHQLGVITIGFVPHFFRLSVPAVLGGVVAEVRTGQNMKKVALTQRGKNGGGEGPVLPTSCGGSVAATWLRTGPASRSWPFCDSVNRTDPGKSRGSNDR